MRVGVVGMSKPTW